MARYDFARHRLFVEAPLAAGARAELTREQFSYLTAVLRLGEGARLLVFNGRDGEWEARLTLPSRKSGALVAEARTRSQEAGADLHLLFAPLKHARLDYMAQKAVEMGASALRPVTTRHTQASRLNVERMRANVIEAAEQCGILSLAQVHEPETLERFLSQRDGQRLLVFCDEDAPISDPIAAFAGADRTKGTDVLIGPEGGFAEEERALLLKQPHVVRLALGPRILRADTAAVAALAVVQTALGDWGGLDAR